MYARRSPRWEVTHLKSCLSLSLSLSCKSQKPFFPFLLFHLMPHKSSRRQFMLAALMMAAAAAATQRKSNMLATKRGGVATTWGCCCCCCCCHCRCRCRCHCCFCHRLWFLLPPSLPPSRLPPPFWRGLNSCAARGQEWSNMKRSDTSSLARALPERHQALHYTFRPLARRRGEARRTA